ncbi:MAG TPA: DUF1801 domain-containing protein [Phnomibacter sp.]|nr:DUF1801 domain-containing protein [Phnomibacter sp.]
MTSNATTPEQYFKELPADRREAVEKLHSVILKNMPKGFETTMNYGMLGYIVPHTIYPAGYHCDPKSPLPFAGLASQKNSINFYHMAIYSSKALYDWFVAEFPKHSTAKLDMGKSCVRFKKPEHIPYKLIGELMKKLTVQDWIDMYESMLKRKS